MSDRPTGPSVTVRFHYRVPRTAELQLVAYQQDERGQADLDEVLTEFWKADDVTQIELLDPKTGDWRVWTAA